MYNLTWTQAQEAMREGKRVKNRHFSGEEWFAFDGCHIVDEQGYHMDAWYKGYDWQDEGWMVLDWVPQEISETEDTCAEHQNMKVIMLCEDFSALEEKIVANYVSQGYDVRNTDYFGGITPSRNPKEKENYNFRITKGRGHNKLQKRKKK